MSEEQYPSFPKIPRLNREIIVTEKIDGTNALIEVVDTGTGFGLAVRAGSRNRWLTHFDCDGGLIDKDNYGFGQWVLDNAEELKQLGVGKHYGEWYGQGIQRGYGLSAKRFALFNTHRWCDTNVPRCCCVVPELYRGPFCEDEILNALDELRDAGSEMVSGFLRPEGVVVFFVAAGQAFKVLLENDEKPKSKPAGADVVTITLLSAAPAFVGGASGSHTRHSFPPAAQAEERLVAQ